MKYPPLRDRPLRADGGVDPEWAELRDRHRKLGPPDAAPDVVVAPRVRRIVNLAVSLGEPLLVTGSPGSGKTLLAHWIASSLRAAGGLLRYQVRSTSSASDLLYRFDAVEYLRGARTAEPAEAEACLTPGVFAVALARTKAHRRPCVVLIDGIDKGPRDLPNDLLRPLEELEWLVPETGQTLGFRRAGLPADLWPVLVVTCAADRQLPDPFLRRCVHAHLRAGDLTSAWLHPGDTHVPDRP